MTDHQYVFQGPVGQMQLSHCMVYIQGIVQKLALEYCNVQVSGIVQQQYDVQKKVVIEDSPKPKNEPDILKLYSEIDDLRRKLHNSQANEERFRRKVAELKESGTDKESVPSDDVLVLHIRRLEQELEKEKAAHKKDVEELNERIDVALEINSKLRQRGYVNTEQCNQQIVDDHIDILATLMCLYPFTPDKDLEFEFGLPVDRIRYAASALGAIKSPEARREAVNYLQRQHRELIERRGGDQRKNLLNNK